MSLLKILLLVFLQLFEQVCVCVNRWDRRKTSLAVYNFLLWQGITGVRGVGDQRRHLPGTDVNVPAGLWWCTWAHSSRSGGHRNSP